MGRKIFLKKVRVALKGGVIFIKVYSKSLFCFINYIFEICHEKIKRGDKRRTEGSGQKNIF